MTLSRQPLAIVYADRAREVALIRGKYIRDVLDSLGAPYRWSESGRGMVVTLGVAHDLEALAQLRHEFLVWSWNPPRA